METTPFLKINYIKIIFYDENKKKKLNNLQSFKI